MGHGNKKCRLRNKRKGLIEGFGIIGLKSLNCMRNMGKFIEVN